MIAVPPVTAAATTNSTRTRVVSSPKNVATPLATPPILRCRGSRQRRRGGRVKGGLGGVSVVWPPAV